jgi:hypothetical protein
VVEATLRPLEPLGPRGLAERRARATESRRRQRVVDGPRDREVAQLDVRRQRPRGVELCGLEGECDLSATNTGPFELDGVPGLRFSVANSLPAFAWGTGPTETGEDLGQPLPEGQDPCASPAWWMRCLDARGTNLVLQTEANPAPWAAYSDPNDNWQPLLWMNSSWRHVADDTVGFAYSVTPWLVGNLVDLPFDGQVSIKRRDNPRPAPVRRFVGNRELLDGVDPDFGAPFAGDEDEFVVVAPWVLDEDPALGLAEDRDRLAARARDLLAGSASEHENDYLETAVWADLVPPASSGTDGPRSGGPGGADDPATPRASAGPSVDRGPVEPATRPLPTTGARTAWGTLLLLGGAAAGTLRRRAA